MPSRHEVVVAQLDPQPADRIAEIGPGWGVAATAVLERLTTGSYVGVDRSPTMVVAAAARNAAAVAAGRATFVVGRADELAGGPFERVFAARVRAMTTPPALAAARRALVPGGRLLLAIDAPSAAVASFAAGDAVAAVAAGGFDDVRRVAAACDGGTVVCVLAIRA